MPHQNSFPRIECWDVQELTAQEGRSAIEVASVLRARTSLTEELSKNNSPRRPFIIIDLRPTQLSLQTKIIAYFQLGYHVYISYMPSKHAKSTHRLHNSQHNAIAGLFVG